MGAFMYVARLTQIWSLDGKVVQVIDRNDTHPLHTGSSDLASDPSAPEWDLPAAVSYEQTPRSNSGFARARRMQNGNKCIVRDVSWHSGEPTLMSTSWDGSDGQLGSIAQHVRRLAHAGMERTREAAVRLVAGASTQLVQFVEIPLGAKLRLLR